MLEAWKAKTINTIKKSIKNKRGESLNLSREEIMLSKKQNGIQKKKKKKNQVWVLLG